MKIKIFTDEIEWLNDRLRRITGTRKIMPKRGTAKLDAFYDLIGENLLKNNCDKSSMNDGTELEPEAIERFEKETKKKVDSTKQLFMRDDNENIAISPDGGLIEGENSSLEIKCLSAGKHIEVFLKQEIPSKYDHQKLQYFVVNDKLEKLYFGFYNPNLIVHDFFYIEIKREDIQFEIDEYLEFQRKTLIEVASIVNDLTF